MKCLTEDCSCEEIYGRGLCPRCYQRLKKRVARGTTTWGALIEQGLCNKRIKHSDGMTSTDRSIRIKEGLQKRSERKQRLYEGGYNMAKRQGKSEEEALLIAEDIMENGVC